MQEQKDKTSKDTTETNGGNTVYCVEYYAETRGSGVRKFSTQDERDIWLIQGCIDDSYIYEEEE